MTTRILPYNEWHKLAETSAADVWERFTDGVELPIVAERDGEIVGLLVLIPVLHAECAWVAESERGGLALGRLWQTAKREARNRYRVRSVWGAAIDDVMGGLLDHVDAIDVPGRHCLVSVEG